MKNLKNEINNSVLTFAVTPEFQQWSVKEFFGEEIGTTFDRDGKTYRAFFQQETVSKSGKAKKGRIHVISSENNMEFKDVDGYVWLPTSINSDKIVEWVVKNKLNGKGYVYETFALTPREERINHWHYESTRKQTPEQFAPEFFVENFHRISEFIKEKEMNQKC
jgi:hypothetical protein